MKVERVLRRCVDCETERDLRHEADVQKLKQEQERANRLVVENERLRSVIAAACAELKGARQGLARRVPRADETGAINHAMRKLADIDHVLRDR